MTKEKKSDSLVFKLDQFASDLIGGCKDVPIQQRVDIFKEVARWVGIKNRLDEASDEGAVLHGYRDKLAGSDAPEAKPDPDRRARGGLFEGQRAGARKGGAARWGNNNDTANDYGGSALDAIKSRLPRTDPRGDERDLDDPGGKADDAGGGDRRLRPGLDGGS